MKFWDFPAFHWLRLHAFIAKGTGSVPGQGTKILPTTQCDRKKKEILTCVTKWINLEGIILNEII